MKNIVFFFAYILSVSLVIGLPTSRSHSSSLNDEDNNNNKRFADKQLDPNVENDSGAVDFDVAETNRSKKSAATTFCVEIKSGTPECVPCQPIYQGFAPPQVIYVTDNNTKSEIDTYNNTVVHRQQEIPVPIQECKKEDDDMFVIIAPPQQPNQPQVSFIQVPVVHPPPPEAPQVILAKGPEVIHKYFPGLLNDSNIQVHPLMPIDSMEQNGMLDFSNPSGYSNLEPMDLKAYPNFPPNHQFNQQFNYLHPEMMPNFSPMIQNQSQPFHPVNQSQTNVPMFYPNHPPMYPTGPQGFQPGDLPVQPGYGFVPSDQNRGNMFNANFEIKGGTLNPPHPGMQPGKNIGRPVMMHPAGGTVEQHESSSVVVDQQGQLTINGVPVVPSQAVDGPNQGPMYPSVVPPQFLPPPQYINNHPGGQIFVNGQVGLNSHGEAANVNSGGVSFGTQIQDGQAVNMQYFFDPNGKIFYLPAVAVSGTEQMCFQAEGSAPNQDQNTIKTEQHQNTIKTEQHQTTKNQNQQSSLEAERQLLIKQNAARIYQYLKQQQGENKNFSHQGFINQQQGHQKKFNQHGFSVTNQQQGHQKNFNQHGFSATNQQQMNNANFGFQGSAEMNQQQANNANFNHHGFSATNQQQANTHNLFNPQGFQFSATNQQQVDSHNLFNPQGFQFLATNQQQKNLHDFNNQHGFGLNLQANLQNSGQQGFAANQQQGNNQNFLNLEQNRFAMNHQQGFAANHGQLNHENGQNLFEIRMQSNGQLMDNQDVQNLNQQQMKNLTFNGGQMNHEPHFYGQPNQQNMNNQNFQSFSHHSFSTNQQQNMDNSNQPGLTFQQSAEWSSKNINEDGDTRQIVEKKNYTAPYKLIIPDETKMKSGSSNLLLSPTKGSLTLPKAKNLLDRKGTKGNEKRGIKRETEEMSVTDKE